MSSRTEGHLLIPDCSDHLDPRQELEEENVEAKIINEEYKIWKKNSVFLYDLLYGYVCCDDHQGHLH